MEAKPGHKNSYNTVNSPHTDSDHILDEDKGDDGRLSGNIGRAECDPALSVEDQIAVSNRIKKAGRKVIGIRRPVSESLNKDHKLRQGRWVLISSKHGLACECCILI